MERGGPGSTGELLQSVVGALEEIREAAGAPTSAAFAAPPAPSLNHVLLQISALHKAFLALSDALTEEVEAAAAQRTLWDERLESVRRELSARLEVAQVLHADLQALADLDAGLHQRVSALEAGQQQQQQQPQGGPLAERVAQLEAQVASLEAQLEQQAAGGGEAVQREVTRLVNAQLEEHLALYEAERLPALVSAAAEQAAARWVAARLPAVLAEQAEAATGAAVEAVMRGAVASLHKACEAAAEAAAGAAADAAAVGMDVVQLAAWCQQVADAHANHEHRLARVEEAGLSRGGTRNGNGGTAQPTPPATPAPPSLQKQAAPSQQPGGGGAQLEQRVWQLEADAPRWQATLQEAVAGLQEQLAALSAQQESQAGTCSELVHSVLADVMALARHTKVLDSEVRGLQRAVSRTQQAVIDSSGAFAKALNLPSPVGPFTSLAPETLA